MFLPKLKVSEVSTVNGVTLAKSNTRCGVKTAALFHLQNQPPLAKLLLKLEQSISTTLTQTKENDPTSHTGTQKPVDPDCTPK